MKTGDKVIYGKFLANVVNVQRNGVKIAYWYQAANMLEPEYRVERVAKRYLSELK